MAAEPEAGMTCQPMQHPVHVTTRTLIALLACLHFKQLRQACMGLYGSQCTLTKSLSCMHFRHAERPHLHGC